MATRKIGTRGKPTSPLHLGVKDLEQILKEARQIRKSLATLRKKYLLATPPIQDVNEHGIHCDYEVCFL